MSVKVLEGVKRRKRYGKLEIANFLHLLLNVRQVSDVERPLKNCFTCRGALRF